MVQPLQRLRRQEAGQRRIEAGGAGVDVRKGPLAASPDVLLLGGVAHLQDDVQALGLVPDGVPGRAEVQQLHHAVLGDVDVVRRHVPVDEALLMDRSQSPEHRDHHVQGVLHTHLSAVVGDVGFETDTLDVVHNEVRGVVLVKVAGDGGNVGVADELGQGPGLFLEPLGAVRKILGTVGGEDGDGGALHTGGQLPGHELLDGYLGLQLGVPGQVGDAEAALAQHPAHDVPVIQNSPGPQGHRVLLLILHQVEAAVGTRAVQAVSLLEAVITKSSIYD